MHKGAPQAAQGADLASEETLPVEQTSASTRSSRMSHAGPIGAVLGAGITFGLSLLIQRKKNSSKKAKDSASTNAVGANDIAAKDGVAASFVEAVTSNPKIEDSDTRAAVRDQAAVAGASVAEMEKQLKMLKAAEDENAKLRAFLAAHLQQSEKASALAEENKALKLVKFKLEAELEEAKAQPVFSLATGEDLQLFKGLLAQRMPTGAHSVRSATTADGGASLDGAATVAGLPAVRKNPGFFSDLAQLLMMAPSSTGASTAKPKPVPRTSKAGGLPTSKPGSQAGSVAASSVTGRGAAAKPAVAVDVGKMLDAYSGGLGRM